MAKCSQCDNPAMYNLHGHPLCLHCASKLMQIQNAQQTQLMALINYLQDQMDEMSGFLSYSRIRIPQPIIQKGNITHNFINVDRSVIGTINTGTISTLNQCMNNIDNLINPDLAKLLSEFIVTILNTKELRDEIKQELMEQIAFLSEQILMPEESKKKGMVRNILESIRQSISNIQGLIAIWYAIYPYLKNIFGL